MTMPHQLTLTDYQDWEPGMTEPHQHKLRFHAETRESVVFRCRICGYRTTAPVSAVSRR